MTGEGRGHVYALALALIFDEGAAPLPVRMGWASFLRRVEPDPTDVREGAVTAHVQGHMRGGRLTGEGVRAALEALPALALPPGSIDGPTVGQVVKHEP